MEFTCNITPISGTLLDNNVVLDDDTLTVEPNLRGNSYTVQIIAYDRKFTSNSALDLVPYDTNCNLVNDSLTYTFTELPAIRFTNSLDSTKTISISTTGNTQCNINLLHFVEIYTDHSNFMLSNASMLPIPREAHYIPGDHSNAVFFGHPTNGNCLYNKYINLH